MKLKLSCKGKQSYKLMLMHVRFEKLGRLAQMVPHPHLKTKQTNLSKVLLLHQVMQWRAQVRPRQIHLQKKRKQQKNLKVRTVQKQAQAVMMTLL